jgi:ureidoglycolate lyase
MNQIKVDPLTADAFAPFGDVLDCLGEADKIINQGLCGRFHDRATLDFTDGAAGISLFNAQPRSLPSKVEMMERHPDGSHAFIPMSEPPFRVIVAQDNNGEPGNPQAFITKSGQAINFHRNIWHGVCTPLSSPGLFAVVDRIGSGENLQEHWFDDPYIIEP